jgi:hypothetical protein
VRIPSETRASWVVFLIFCLIGCGGHSDREIQNARTFEALLTAVSLRDSKELEQDAGRIEERHASGGLSEGNYREILQVIDKARARDWAGAERRAYEFRARFGDEGAYFR